VPALLTRRAAVGSADSFSGVARGATLARTPGRPCLGNMLAVGRGRRRGRCARLSPRALPEPRQARHPTAGPPDRTSWPRRHAWSSVRRRGRSGQEGELALAAFEKNEPRSAPAAEQEIHFRAGPAGKLAFCSRAGLAVREHAGRCARPDCARDLRRGRSRDGPHSGQPLTGIRLQERGRSDRHASGRRGAQGHHHLPAGMVARHTRHHAPARQKPGQARHRDGAQPGRWPRPWAPAWSPSPRRWWR